MKKVLLPDLFPLLKPWAQALTGTSNCGWFQNFLLVIMGWKLISFKPNHLKAHFAGVVGGSWNKVMCLFLHQIPGDFLDFSLLAVVAEYT